MDEQYCYSFDGEYYHGCYDTEEEAIEEAKKESDAEEVWVGTCEEPDLNWNTNEEYIIDSMAEQLGDEVGEAAENFEVTDEEQSVLAKMIDETVKTWIEQEGIKPQCYAVLNEHKVSLSK